jgi:hypothetical protein
MYENAVAMFIGVFQELYFAKNVHCEFFWNSFSVFCQFLLSLVFSCIHTACIKYVVWIFST